MRATAFCFLFLFTLISSPFSWASSQKTWPEETRVEAQRLARSFSVYRAMLLEGQVDFYENLNAWSSGRQAGLLRNSMAALSTVASVPFYIAGGVLGVVAFLPEAGPAEGSSLEPWGWRGGVGLMGGALAGAGIIVMLSDHILDALVNLRPFPSSGKLAFFLDGPLYRVGSDKSLSFSRQIKILAKAEKHIAHVLFKNYISKGEEFEFEDLSEIHQRLVIETLEAYSRFFIYISTLSEDKIPYRVKNFTLDCEERLAQPLSEAAKR